MLLNAVTRGFNWPRDFLRTHRSFITFSRNHTGRRCAMAVPFTAPQ
jgi:hypothetical protein